MKTYKFTINGNAYEVAVNSVEGNIASVNVNGMDYQVELENAPAAAPAAAPKAPAAEQPAVQSPAPAAVPAGAGEKVPSPLPGVIIEVSVKEGQAVKAGQKVAVIEAMKMENEILAPADGTIKAVHVSAGQAVQQGDALLDLA